MPSPTPPPSRKKQLGRAFAWIGFLWLTGWVTLCLSEAIGWTDSLEGLQNGLLMGLIFSPLSLVVLIPFGGLGYLIGSLRGLRPWRRMISLSVPCLACMASLIPGIAERYNPGKRFSRITGVSLPAHSAELRHHFAGGLLRDRTEVYIFDSPAAETLLLIQALALERSQPPQLPLQLREGGGGLSPNLGTWQGLESWHSSGPGRFLNLYTDGDHARVYVISGSY